MELDTYNKEKTNNMKATHINQTGSMKGRPFRPVKAPLEPGYYHNIYSEEIVEAISTLLLEGERTNIRHVDERIKDNISSIYLSGACIEEYFPGCSEYQEQAEVIARKLYPTFYKFLLP